MSHLKYADAKYVFLTDFDGTITLLVSSIYSPLRSGIVDQVVTIKWLTRKHCLFSFSALE